MKKLIKTQFLLVLITSSVCFAGYSDSIRKARQFQDNPKLFVKNCSVDSLKRDSFDRLSTPLVKESMLSKSECLSQNPYSDKRWAPKSAEDTAEVSGMFKCASEILTVETYLSGKNVWDGVVFLEGPVYVYSEDNNPASLEIKEGTIVVPMSFYAGIYTMEGSSFKARRVYFGPTPDIGTLWEGIYIIGKPREFLFDENEVRASRVGINLENTQSIKITDSIFKWGGWGIVAYPGANVYLLNNVVDDAYYNGVTMVFETVSGQAEFCDLNQDNQINYLDFAILAKDWLIYYNVDWSDPNSTDPNIADPNITGPAGNICGDPNIVNSEDLQFFCNFWLGDVDTSSDAIPGTALNMENCTITGSFASGYAQDFGIFVTGTEKPENAGTVSIQGCLITSSLECAIYQAGWQAGFWQDNAFFNNIYVTNPGNPFIDVNSIFLGDNEDPFEFYVDNGFEYWDMLYHIWQPSRIVNAVQRHIYSSLLLGKSNDQFGVPDMGNVDIGYHYPSNFCNEGVQLRADINQDSIVNLEDFKVLAVNWMGSTDPNNWLDPNDPLYWEPNALADLDGDSFIDVNDLTIMFDKWLTESSGTGNNGRINVLLNGIYLPKTQQSITAKGYLDFAFEFENFSYAVASIQIERNGETVLVLNFDENYDTHFTEKSWKCGESASYIFRALLENGQILCSKEYDFSFTNEISYSGDIGFCQTEDTVFSVTTYNQDVYNCRVFGCFSDPNDPNNALWATDFQGSQDITIPKEVFGDSFPIYRMKMYKKPPQTLATPSLAATGITYPPVGSKDDLSLDDLINLVLDRTTAEFWWYTRGVVSIGNRDLDDQNTPRVMLEEMYRDLHPLGLNVVFIDSITFDNTFSDRREDMGYLTLKHWLTNATLWYHLSHGNNDLIGEKPRQVISINNKAAFSDLRSSYEPGEEIPPDLEELRFGEDAYCVRLLLKNKRVPFGAVWFDGCKHAATNEFPTALGILGPNQPPGGSVFIGWKDTIPKYDNRVVSHFQGDYGTYRKRLALAFTRKCTLGSSRDNECFGLEHGHVMRDNLQIIGAIDNSSYWATPDISTPFDRK